MSVIWWSVKFAISLVLPVAIVMLYVDRLYGPAIVLALIWLLNIGASIAALYQIRKQYRMGGFS
jgi:hypothetical protein